MEFLCQDIWHPDQRCLTSGDIRDVYALQARNQPVECQGGSQHREWEVELDYGYLCFCETCLS